MNINLANIDFVPGQGGGGEAVIRSLDVTENGTYRAPSGVDGYNPVKVNVSGGSSITPEEQDALDTLVDSSEGVLYTDVIKGNEFNIKPWSGNFNLNMLFPMVDGSIYLLDFPKIYKWTPETMNFEFIVEISSSTGRPLWIDNSGRLFQGNTKEIDLTTGSSTDVNLNWNEYTYNRNRHNLFYGDRGIWCVPYTLSDLKLYDEQLKQFTGTYTTTLPQDYSGGIADDICNVFTYKGHKLFHTNTNKTYEVVETNDGLTVTDVTGVYFPIPTTFTISDPYYMISAENGNLYYIHNNYKNIYTGTGTWETFDISSNYFSSNYAVSGNYVLGGDDLQTKYSILNLGPTQNITSWTSVNNVAVDLFSEQNISGQKKFNSVDILNLSTTLIQTMNGDSQLLLGKNTTEADKMEFTVPGKFTLNGVNIATTDNCFINKLIATSGPNYEGICASPSTYSYYNGFFKTPSGRLMYDNNTTAYEFDGTQFNQLQTVTVHPEGRNFATITDGLFAKDINDNLIKWNDETSNWEVIISDASPEYIWAADTNTLRAGYTHKLSNTDGTYSWVDDPTANSISTTTTTISYVIGENVYMVSGYDVYKYEESSKTFTRIKYANTFILRCIVFENNLYYIGNDGFIHILDFSQNPIADNYTDIIYTGSDYLYIEYNNKLYITNPNSENNFGYCYGIKDTTPEVPASDGTYSLKAVRAGDQITYNWVLDV